MTIYFSHDTIKKIKLLEVKIMTIDEKTKEFTRTKIDEIMSEFKLRSIDNKTKISDIKNTN